ncbi:MAG: amidohydrolase family protein, partial [Rubellimicrobium sp.]|nr:amidohydrolase family protein [Rubellimicrobium sp.]
PACRRCPRCDAMIFDAHHHLWTLAPGSHPWLDDPARAGLRQPAGPADYLAAFPGEDIIGTVWIEALAADPEEELRQAEAVRLASGGRIATALVAHSALDAPDIGARLDRLMRLSPALRGIRDIVSAAPGRATFARAPDLLSRPAFARGLAALAERGLSFDLMLLPHQMQEAATVITRHPTLSVAIEHAGSPEDQSPEGLAQWEAGLAALAAHPGTILKVSALQCLDPDWSDATLAPLLATMARHFTPARLAWGSDHPVHDRACPGAEALACLRRLTDRWAEADRDSLFRRTAAAFYRCPPHA